MIIHSSRMRIESGWLLKKGTTFPTEIKSSPIKHKHICSLSHHLHAQSIKFCIGQVDVRSSTNKLISTKYKRIRPLSHWLRVQSIKFGIGQVDVRRSTYKYLRLLQ